MGPGPNLKLVRSWPGLSGSVVHLKGIGHTNTFPRQVLILQPVGSLVLYAIRHEALLNIVKQFAWLSNLVQGVTYTATFFTTISWAPRHKHQDTDAALLVDMRTLIPLLQVLNHGWNSLCCKRFNLLSHVKLVTVWV